MITKWLAILALVAAMNSQPVTPATDVDAKPTPPPVYYCLDEDVDWPHLPEWDNCVERNWSDPR